MKINTIEIQNFKGFEHKTFSFNPSMTVLIGDNGKGKTSILEALSFVLGTFLIGIDGISTRDLKQNERRKIVFSPKNFEIKLPFKINVQQTLLGKEYNYFRDAKKEKGISTHVDAKPLIEEAKLLTSQVRNGENVNLPLIAYYSTARLTRKNEKIDYEKMASRLIAYDNVLNPELVQYKFLEWLKTQEDEIKKFQRKEEISLYKAFTQTISSMIPEWTDIQFSWRMDDMLGQLNNGEWMSFGMLSDGYQNIIRLAGDIAYRAITLNPHLGINAVKETEGVVLIDEIDMHLHPNWQKTVIADFKRTFPKIQFIVTTHSPFIVQSLRADEIINLDGDTNGQPYTKSIEDIAESEMHVEDVIRSQKFLNLQELASEYFDLIEQGKTSKNDDETRKIKEKLDEIELEFNNDPVYIALMKAERKTGLK